MENVAILHADTALMAERFDQFCDLLRDVVDGGSSVNFIAPMDAEINRAYWRRVASEVEAGQRIVIAAVADHRVVGCAHLVPASTPNGHHRAEVQKVLVHSMYRRRGIAQTLMVAIEDAARKIGRWLLVLDTEEGSAAQPLYEKLGYRHAGGVPEFALTSDGSHYHANVYFYKKL